MCYRELIAYQCGHRSIGVLRICPLTTAGHNFPVCGHAPDKPHYAETMCAACERQLHSRWVLIREWEHRWLHERGACGCDVTFPGLLYTPRVIGDNSAAGTPASATGGNPSTTAEDGGNSSALKDIAAADDSDTGQAEGNQSVENTTARAVAGDGRIPALFSEEVTVSGERRVAIRLPSLYAAEWQADHRALHDSGKCSCPTTFTPFQPRIPDEGLTPTERGVLRQWHELEAEKEKNEQHSHDVGDTVDGSMRRIVDIENVFGKFTTETEQPKVKLPRRVDPAISENQWAETRPEVNRRHHDRRFQNRRRRGGIPSHHHKQPAKAYSPPHGQHLVLAAQSTTAYDTVSQGYSYSYQLATANPAPTAGCPLFPGFPAHQRPHYFFPAHPAYATPATYTNTIPHGASPWQDPGPYHTPGFIYDPATSPSQQGQAQGQGQSQVLAHLRLPAPDRPSTGNNDKGKQQEDPRQQQQQDVVATNQTASSTPIFPLCGLPVGAGPEGISHVPSWLHCRLRRGSMSISAITAGEEYGTTSAGEEGVEVDEKDHDQDDPMPPSPPPRRRSAST